MGRERRGHTLQTTAIFNETYLRLIDQRSGSRALRPRAWVSRATARSECGQAIGSPVA
ncbi:MAG TPA: hypothetical protein VFV34_02440 [Blastocatellia bacterium]|nr:hypothetical protein [Blastocatellia bacterium]